MVNQRINDSFFIDLAATNAAAGVALVTGVFASGNRQDYVVDKLFMYGGWGGLTVISTFVLGLCKGLTATEVKEWFDARPVGKEDVPAMEQANRQVFPLFVGQSGQGTFGHFDGGRIAELRGLPPAFKRIDEDQGWSVFLMNIDDSVTMAAGEIDGRIFATGRWELD